MTVKTLLKSCGARFHFDERGNVAIIFGLTLVPAVMMTSFALDYARYASARSGLQGATDSAALSVAAKMSTATPAMTADAITNMAKSVVASQPQFKNATITTTTPTTKEVCVKASLSIDNSLLKYGTQFDMNGTNIGYATGLTSNTISCATIAGGIDPNTTYEIALVVDNSGSMSASSDGQSKMSILRSAATSFVNTVYSQAPAGKVKMSIAPFNAAVVAVDSTVSSNRTLNWIDTQGNSSLHWNVFGGSKAAANADGFYNRFDIYAKLKAKKSSWDWNGCFEPQPYPMDVNDTPPDLSNADTLFVPYLGPDEPNSSAYLDSYINDTQSSTPDCGSTSNNWTKLIRTCKYKNPSTTSSGGSPDGVCSSQPSQVLMRLTTTQATVSTKISNLREGGTTNLHDGFMWGWRTLSPNAPFADARPYNTVDNRKVMVFMSDGFNNWRSNPGTATGSDYEILGYYSLNGAVNARLPDGSQGDHVNYQAQLALAGPNNPTNFHPNADSTGYNYSADWSRRVQDELTLEACTNAKAKGIEVYTIGFTIPNDPIDSYGLKVLKDCATDANHYFEAKNAGELNAAFATIGSGQGVLRLVAPPTTN